MKVPYFYLEVGDINYFQPQNQYLGVGETLIEFGEFNQFNVRVESEPEVGYSSLYLNGRCSRSNFNILRSIEERFLDAVNQINSRSIVNYDDIPF